MTDEKISDSDSDSDADADVCPVCGTQLIDTGYDGDYKLFSCPNCSVEIYRPASDVAGDGMSMEDLQNLSDF